MKDPPSRSAGARVGTCPVRRWSSPSLITVEPMERPSRLPNRASEKLLAWQESACEDGSMEKLPTPDEANSALTVAGSASSTARGPRPMPSWLPPAAGLLLAGGFVNFGLAYKYRDEPAFLVAAAICLVLFLLAIASTVRAGGVVPAPAGTTRERTLRQLPALLPFIMRRLRGAVHAASWAAWRSPGSVWGYLPGSSWCA